MIIPPSHACARASGATLQEYLSGKARFGSDRETSVSAAQAERDWHMPFGV